MQYAVIDSPYGPVTVVRAATGLRTVTFASVEPEETWECVPELSATQQLKAYFRGDHTAFDLDVDPQGTDFQKSVWDLLTRIPFGQTTTYSELAIALGDPKLSRAVGAANARNPLAIVVPCHRVIGANGTLTGYAGGLDRKRGLLTLEGSLPPSLFG